MPRSKKVEAIIERFKLPQEVTVDEAAELLTVNAKTVLRYIEQGAIEARNIAPPKSKRARWRIQLTNVLAMRERHSFQDHVYEAKAARAAARPNNRRASRYVPKHVH